MKYKRFYIGLLVLFLGLLSFAVNGKEGKHQIMIPFVNFNLVTPVGEFDNEGFLWLADISGLYRYNGQFLTQIYPKDSTGNKVSISSIKTLCFDPKAKLMWIGTDYGELYSLNINNYQVREYNLPSNANPSAQNIISSIYVKGASEVIIGTNGQGLFLFNKVTGIFSPIATRNFSYLETVNVIIEINDRIFCGTNNGLHIFNQQYLEVSQKEFEIAQHELIKNKAVDDIIEDIQSVYITTDFYVIRWDKHSNKIEKLLYTYPHRIREIELHQDVLWVATRSAGLIAYDLKNGQQTVYKHEADNELSLPENSVYWLKCSPKQPVLFLGLASSFRSIDLTTPRFKKTDIRKFEHSVSSIPFDIAKDHNGNIWYKAGGFLHRYSETDDDAKVINITFKGENIRIRSIYTHNKQLWVSGKKLLFHINSSGEILHTIKITVPDYLEKIPWLDYHFKSQNDSMLWFSMNYGLIRINTQNYSYECFWIPLSEKEHINPILSAMEFENNNIWIGSKTGWLYTFNIGSKTFKKYRIYKNIKKKPQQVFMQSLYKADSFLYIGTYSSGLIRFNTHQMEQDFDFSVPELNKCQYALFPDKNGKLWAATNNGLCHLDLNNNTVQVFSKEEGTLFHDFNENGYFIDKNGQALLTGSKGFIEFNINKVISNTKPAPVYVKDFAHGYITELVQNIEPFLVPLTDSLIEIYESNKSLFIDYSVINYLYPHRNFISYKLEGHDTAFSKIHASTPILFNGLKAGTYSLKIHSINNDGIANPNAYTIKIKVKNHFYQMAWFWGLIVILCIGFIVFMYGLRLKLLKKKQIRLQELVDEQTMELKVANEELSEGREEIMQQNEELNYHRNFLQQEVEKQTEELKKALVRAEESDKLKTSFIHNLSHEIRTPMNAIFGFIEFLDDEYYSKEERAEFVRIIREKSTILLKIIDDLLFYSMVETNQLTITNEEFVVGELIQKCYQKRESMDGTGKVFFRLEIDNALKNVSIRSDKVKLEKIIGALLDNAFKFTNTGEIILGAKLLQGAVEFYVQDTGIGISKEDINKIYNPFHQAEMRKDFQHTGLGLGLSIALRLSNILNGELNISSSQDQGTYASFYLSVETLPIDNPGVETQDTQVEEWNGDLLVVDDEQVNFSVIKLLLNKSKLNLAFAKNGKEAITFMEQNPHTKLILMDLKMPEMDGFTASQIITERFPQTLIIAQSAYTLQQDLDRAFAAGCVDFITKPFNREIFYATISKHLE
jgi:signal transduction histidine kinase/ligand-binding sensor domain-containing protein